MRNVCVSDTKEDFISKIKTNGKNYHIMENCELWSGVWYDYINSNSEGLPLPDKVETVVLPGEYGWTHKPDIEIFNQLTDLLSAIEYKIIFSAAGDECHGD